MSNYLKCQVSKFKNLKMSRSKMDKEKNVNCSEIVNFFESLMQLLGIWPRQNSSTPYKILGFTSILLLGTMTITTFTQVLKNPSNIEDVSFGVCSALATFQLFFKFIILFHNKPHFLNILVNLKNPIFNAHEHQLNAYIQKKIHYSKKLLAAFLISTFAAFVFQAASPFVGTHLQRPLPIPFPLDVRKQSFIVYILIFLFQSVASLVVAWGFPCFDVLIFAFMGIAVGQLEILNKKIIHAVDCFCPKSKTTRNVRNQEIANNLLKDCVVHHVAIERYIASIEDTFTLIFLVELILLSVAICFMGFNLFLMPVASVYFARMFFFSAAGMLDLWIYCAQGNEITVQSQKIGKACYMSEWTNCSPSVRKSLFIIMERSKRPFVLTAGKFIPLSLPTLLAILRTGCSYLTVLRNLYATSR